MTTYLNTLWAIIGQNLYRLQEINQMEREMSSYLEWELNIKPAILAEFEGKLKKDLIYPAQPFKLNTISIPSIPIPIHKSPPKPVQNPLPPPLVPVKATYDSCHATNDYTPALSPPSDH
ncbi:hypothetical protein JAAARDRAFT_194461 [Jaapia argillacea MUCL 33604]|uniref:Cyclin N-terminal domain-containing protein n=1 Tax=Jaapia argillacea MUCL 33604 TaxID=933084 RepID=A0A067PTZ3_9AGAM|nr:hypothetical protein JAAARDRAFT_194461 [Jaapia argillacea MUCL 33604]